MKQALCSASTPVALKLRTLPMDIKDIKPDLSIDCVGLACPMPIFKTSNKIKEM